jgi:hypothetical protein
MHKKEENLPQQGLLFIVPPLVKPPGPGPSLRCLEALGILSAASNQFKQPYHGLLIDEFGRRFYWKKGWQGLQLYIQSLAYLNILIKKGWVWKDAETNRYFLSIEGERVLNRFRQL